MFQVNDDLSIYVTRGDMVFLRVTAMRNGSAYTFEAGEVIRIKVYGKKDAENVVLQKDFPVTATSAYVDIILTEEDTKIGEVISKHKDYWYEVELNPYDNPMTIIGYDEDGAKIFRLFPEGADIPEYVPDPEVIKVIDTELDMASERPVQNQVIARAFANLQAGYQAVHEAVADKFITPEMYGAIGDGVVDDTKAIQNMFSAAAKNKNSVNLSREASYLIKNKIDVGNCNVFGNSATFILNSDVDYLLHSTGDYLIIDGLNFKKKDNSFKMYNRAIFTENVKNTTVTNCTFDNFGTCVHGLKGGHFHCENIIINSVYGIEPQWGYGINTSCKHNTIKNISAYNANEDTGRHVIYLNGDIMRYANVEGVFVEKWHYNPIQITVYNSKPADIFLRDIVFDSVNAIPVDNEKRNGCICISSENIGRISARNIVAKNMKSTLLTTIADNTEVDISDVIAECSNTIDNNFSVISLRFGTRHRVSNVKNVKSANGFMATVTARECSAIFNEIYDLSTTILNPLVRVDNAKVILGCYATNSKEPITGIGEYTILPFTYHS